jgi:hypothetical protein
MHPSAALLLCPWGLLVSILFGRIVYLSSYLGSNYCRISISFTRSPQIPQKVTLSIFQKCLPTNATIRSPFFLITLLLYSNAIFGKFYKNTQLASRKYSKWESRKPWAMKSPVLYKLYVPFMNSSRKTLWASTAQGMKHGLDDWFPVASKSFKQ